MSTRMTVAVNAGFVAGGFALAVALYSRLPALVPVHFGVGGEANRFAEKPWGAFELPVVLAAVGALFLLLPRLSPRGFRMGRFAGGYQAIATAAIGFLFVASAATLLSAAGYPVDQRRVVGLGLGALMVVIGNYMGKLRRNFYVGIRTPWTLASEAVWERTHRFGGPLFVAAGVVAMALALLSRSLAPAVGVVVAAALIASAYSYLVYRRLEQHLPEDPDPT